MYYMYTGLRDIISVAYVSYLFLVMSSIYMFTSDSV